MTLYVGEHRPDTIKYKNKTSCSRGDNLSDVCTGEELNTADTITRSELGNEPNLPVPPNSLTSDTLIWTLVNITIKYVGYIRPRERARAHRMPIFDQTYQRCWKERLEALQYEYRDAGTYKCMLSIPNPWPALWTPPHAARTFASKINSPALL